MKESTFRRPPIQEVREKQEGKGKEVGKIEDKEEKKRLRKKLGEYYSPSSGWKGINRSPSYWDRIREQRRKKRRISNTSKEKNRIDKQKQKNRKRKKGKNK